MSVRKLRRRGGFRNLSGSTTHHTLQTEPSFKALHARRSETNEGISQQSPNHLHPSKGHRIIRGKGTQKTPNAIFEQPLEFGSNYKRTLAGKRHYKEGGLAEGGRWIQSALPPSSKGKLHQHLGIPQGQKIPLKRIKKAEHSPNQTIAKEARLADTLRKFHHH